MGLSHPISSKLLTRTGNNNFKIGAASMQGYRTGMKRTFKKDKKMRF